MDFAGVFVLELNEAAAGAPIAEGFPFLTGHLPKLFVLPEWVTGRHSRLPWLTLKLRGCMAGSKRLGHASAMICWIFRSNVMARRRLGVAPNTRMAA
jgi:hypothetical protein